MKIAVVGCSHGKLDQIYKDVKQLEISKGFLIDLIIICGDIQAARNENDLKCMALPETYKELGDFHGYYSGKKTATYLTLVIGGNTEASNYFQTLPYGGWIAFNIFYMGYSSVVKFKGVRIAGISGIFNRSSYTKGYYEHLPYNKESIKSVYYTRYLEVFRMLQLNDKLDVLFTHDWPSEIYRTKPKIKDKLIKIKRLKEDIEKNQLGSPLYQIILDRLKPKKWFAAHYHINIQINYLHNQSSNNETNQQDQTDFIALDKCKSGRSYLEIVEIKSDEYSLSPLEYDLEWLAILKATNKFVSTQKNPSINIPHPNEFINYDLDDLKEEIKEIFQNKFKIPIENDFNFKPICSNGIDLDPDRKTNYTNEQTTKFCEKLGLTDPISVIINLINGKVNNPAIINIDSDDDNEWNSDDETNVKNEKNSNRLKTETNSNSISSNSTNNQSNKINLKSNNQSIQNNLKLNNHLINDLFDNQKLNHLSNRQDSSNLNIKSEKYDPISSSSENETSDNQKDNNYAIGQFKVRSISSYIKSENNLTPNETLNEPLINENLDVPMANGDLLEEETSDNNEFINNIKKEKDLNGQSSTNETIEESTGDTLQDSTADSLINNIKKEKNKFLNKILNDKNLDVPMTNGDLLEEQPITENNREFTNNIKKEKDLNEQSPTGDLLEESINDNNEFTNIKRENENETLDEPLDETLDETLDEPFRKRIKTEKHFF